MKHSLPLVGGIVLTFLLAACVISSDSPAQLPAPTVEDTTVAATQIYTTADSSTLEIPLAPQRIVTQDFLGELLVLGIKPIGTPSRFFDDGLGRGLF